MLVSIYATRTAIERPCLAAESSSYFISRTGFLKIREDLRLELVTEMGYSTKATLLQTSGLVRCATTGNSDAIIKHEEVACA